MKTRQHLIIIMLLLTALTVSGQESTSRQIYNQAESEYAIGRIEQALAILQKNIKSFTGNTQQSAYRLMALCWLSLDEDEKAEQWTRNLLSQDPYYTASAQDPQRFIDMVESFKLGLTAKITTASNQAESLAEVPVPTTLITEDMIHNCGGQNLQEVLAAYVPGMNIIDCNDDINIAMRGIYSNGQEKILIMLNGHRLNSYCTNIASPDFSISLEKIKQIEVLRGPASSLYGGVALTGVVNIITKQGADVDGIKIRGGIGNYGQLHGDVIFGKRYFDLDLIVWGSIYKNKGEEQEAPDRDDIYGMPEKYVTIGHIGEKPSYDFGFQLNWKNLRFLYDTHFSQVVAPFTPTTLATSYARDKYRTFNDLLPSFATSSSHADLSYSRQFGILNLTGSLTYDHSDLTHYQVLYDDYLDDLSTIFGLPTPMDSIFSSYNGVARFINGVEHTLGVQFRGDVSYINNERHKGLVTFGADFSHFNMDDLRYQLVYEFTNTTQENTTLEDLNKDYENCFDIFAQVKHQWRSFIVNAGLRYDYKNHYDKTFLSELSPRLALIYVQPKWNVKLSYSKAFVDAPYFYRKNNDINYIIEGLNPENNENLNPEILHSWQLTFAGNQWIKGLDFEVNGFFNNAKDLIYNLINNYYNGGINKTIGLELMVSYRQPRFSTNINLTWTRNLKAKLAADYSTIEELIPSVIDDNNNTPAIMSNVILSWEATKRLKLFTHVTFEGKQTSYNLDVVKIAQTEKYLKIASTLPGDDKLRMWYTTQMFKLLSESVYQGEMDPRVIFNMGAEYNIGHLTLGFNVRNLFNTHYFQSGMNTKLVPQKGRWFMFSVGYKI